MKKISIVIAMILSFVFTSEYVFASVATAVDDAAVYLQVQDESAMNVIALIVAGESVDTTFLKTVDTSSAIKISKPIMAIVARGEDPRTYGEVNLISTLKTKYDGTQIGDINAINDDIWAILALVSAGEGESEEVAGMVTFLRDNQSDDGGWSWGVGGASDTDDTAVAIMALIASGVPVGDKAILDARSYILGNQNDDGGFLSDPAWSTDSNTATDAWVIAMINALGEDPSTWTKNEKSPVDHALSLQDEDGGFWWVEEGTSEWNNKVATADLVIALSGHTFPTHIGEFVAAGVSVEYRFEGSLNQVCMGETTAVTVLDVIGQAAAECPFEDEYTEFDFGSMLTRINEDTGNWMYFVNYNAALVGAADYTLADNDSVLWYFAGSEWGWLPTRLIVDNSDIYNVGDTISGFVEYYDENTTSWLALEGAVVQLNGADILTDGTGSFSAIAPQGGVYEIAADKQGYVRTGVTTLIVGDTSEGVELSANIVQSGGVGDEGQGPGSSIGLSVSPAILSFGDIVPGKTNVGSVTVTNSGTGALQVKAQIVGDSIFHFLKIANELWGNFESLFGVSETQTLELELSVPQSYNSYGNKSGSLIFWGSSVE